MKKKIPRILGVGLSFILLVSLMVMAAPASAGTLSLSGESNVPKDADHFLAPAGTNIVDIAVNGDVIYIATENTTDSILYKSTDAGKTWTSLDSASDYPTDEEIEQVAVAPDDPDIVVASFESHDVYYSSNGGSSWYNMERHDTCLDIFDIDVSPGTSKKVAVAGVSSDVDVGAELFTMSLAIASKWKVESGDPGFRPDQDSLKAVKFSPHYTIDKIIAVVSDSDTEAHFQVFRVETNEWNGEIGFYEVSDWGSGELAPGGDEEDWGGVSLGTITGGLSAGSISLEPEYLGTDEESRIAFVGIADGTDGGGVLRLTDAYLKEFGTWSAGNEGDIGSVAYHEAGKLVAGSYGDNKVYYTTNPMASSPKFERLNSLKQPGGGGPTTVAWSGDTVVAGTQGDESAFAVSTDDGYSFNDISMIDTTIEGSSVIDDVAVSADGSVIYLSTHTTADDTSIWRKGSDWTRILSIDREAGEAAFLIRLAPEDADVVYLSSKTTNDMWASKDGGSTKWKAIPAYKLDKVQDFEVESADVVYAIDTGFCSKTTNTGQSWGSAEGLDGITDAHSITVAPNGDVLVGGETGKVAFSKDGGSTFTKITDKAAASAAVHIVVDDDYADNNKIYIGAGSVVERGSASKTMGWSGRGPTFPTNYKVTGMAQVDGVVYVLTANSSDSRLYRALELETGADADLCLWSYKEGADEVYDSEPRALKMSSGPKFWAIDTVSPALESMLDPIAVTGPTLKSPADGFSVPVNPESGSAYNVTFIWERYSTSAITACQLQIATDSVFNGIVFDEEFTGITTDTIAKVIGPNAPRTAEFNPGTTYYWRVRVSATGPMYSAWSATRNFRIESPVAFELISPALGATNVPIEPTLTWEEFEGAISYEVMLAEDPTFAVFDWIRSSDTTYYKVMEALNYATTYYWRVRGITGAPPAAGKAAPGGPWVSGLFTTAAEPVEPAPPIVIEPTPPAPEKEITVVKVPAPSMIPPWMLLTIIGIGAVLVIALIVLIVRTRRVV